ncbi:hypothetical protein HYH02_002833 [Chlamydomonas schloesseri]|uniref:THH1/TOM1/TOM3 domain-containing protein n=1 Tax=Chlamydomonas schloesseri TaxID=2026947 RepID=A0A835WTS2_9CHLO|nr:hypothetical protein HYH02_002833 [Chlamydomonas schloesseri]|eukprot:KAG2452596.1 hypothetical protein HYH02_002833 [Chlamydomonas schloesseri]
MRELTLGSLAAPTLASISTTLVIPFPDWWKKAEQNEALQTYSNYGIGAAYGLIGLVAFVQLLRLQLRVPEYGWTTQKVFHLLNCLVSVLRCSVFFFRPALEGLHPVVTKLMLLDLPGLLFFTTYTLLVLFWAEIYQQARNLPAAALRPTFLIINIVVYAVLAGLWALIAFGKTGDTQELAYTVSNLWLAAVFLAAAAGFLLYGGRLFVMLQRFPIESRGRRKKLREVGLVTSICAGCFTFRALMIATSAVDRDDLEVDMLGHPLLNIAYYSLAEILPSAAVLYILRKLPPKRHNTQGYQQIPSQ